MNVREYTRYVHPLGQSPLSALTSPLAMALKGLGSALPSRGSASGGGQRDAPAVRVTSSAPFVYRLGFPAFQSGEESSILSRGADLGVEEEALRGGREETSPGRQLTRWTRAQLRRDPHTVERRTQQSLQNSGSGFDSLRPCRRRMSKGLQQSHPGPRRGLTSSWSSGDCPVWGRLKTDSRGALSTRFLSTSFGS